MEARGLAHHEFQMGTWPIALQSYSSLGQRYSLSCHPGVYTVLAPGLTPKVNFPRCSGLAGFPLRKLHWETAGMQQHLQKIRVYCKPERGAEPAGARSQSVLF